VSAPSDSPRPRLSAIDRSQLVFRTVDVERLIDDDHSARSIWEMRRTAGISFLLAVHLSRPWCALRSLLLDDPVQHIDDYRALNLVEVLSSVRRTGRQVIVAVEDASLADVLCRRLRSSVNEDGRRFELAVATDGSSTIVGRTTVLPLPDAVLQVAEAS
jgi:chromosome segregation protein